MVRRLPLLLVALLISSNLVGMLGCGAASPPDLATMVEEVRPGVVRIDTAAGSGSGVIFDTTSEGGALVLTNYHVVEDAGRIRVRVADSHIYNADVRGFDTDLDLAVLSICCGNFSSLSFGDASSIKPGAEVIAIGYPLDLPGAASVTRGIVSAIRSEAEFEIIQMDAPINPGNSGGPLLSLSGGVLGINTFSVRDTEGLGFAISERTVQAILPELKGGSRFAAAPTPTPKPRTVPTSRPTPTRIPRPAATPRPTVTPTQALTYSQWLAQFTRSDPTATITPRPTATPNLALTQRPNPTFSPVQTPPPEPARGDYFTRGSSQDDVLHAQGTPTEINSYQGLGEETWTYGRLSTVAFSLPGGRVTEWNNYDGALKVLLLPTTGNSTTPGYFTRGSSQDDVLHAQGTPTEINSYQGLGEETWTYGRLSTVAFSLPDGLVTEWNNYDGNLKIQ